MQCDKLGLGLVTKNKGDRFLLLLIRNKCSYVPHLAHGGSGVETFCEVTQQVF